MNFLEMLAWLHANAIVIVTMFLIYILMLAYPILQHNVLKTLMVMLAQAGLLT